MTAWMDGDSAYVWSVRTPNGSLFIHLDMVEANELADLLGPACKIYKGKTLIAWGSSNKDRTRPTIQSRLKGRQ